MRGYVEIYANYMVIDGFDEDSGKRSKIAVEKSRSSKFIDWSKMFGDCAPALQCDVQGTGEQIEFKLSD